MMDFDKFKKINDERPNYGEIEDADVVTFYKNSGCGDGYRIFLKIKQEGDKKSSKMQPLLRRVVDLALQPLLWA